jgi:hypothetical protein
VKQPRRWRMPLLLICALLLIGASQAGCAESDSGDGGDEEQASGGGDGGGDDGRCGTGDPEKPNEASDDCTPHVAPNKKVTVDGIVYKITRLRGRSSIGNASIGFDEKASGVFLVIGMSAHSTKGETVQLSDDTFSVTCGGCPSYSTDSDGTFAVTGEGGEPFFLTDIQPDTTKGGVIVFDVPKKILTKKLELRINELGFGEGHGFIQLPPTGPG